MPYGIRIRKGQDKPYCVVKSKTEETVKCHKTMAKARAHKTALDINVHRKKD